MERSTFPVRYVLIPTILILFLIAFYWVYEDIKERTVNEFENEQLILARTASQGITTFINESQADLAYLSHFKGIIDFTDDSKTIMASYYENHKDIIAGITRVDTRGVIQYTYPYNPSVIGSDISYQTHVRQIIYNHLPVISDAFLSAQGYMAIALHYPIFKGEVYAGSLAILIPIDKLGEIYLGKIKIRGTGNAWLLSENGIELYCPIAGHTGGSFLEFTQKDVTAVELLERIKKEQSGTTKSIHPEAAFDGKRKRIEKYIAFYRTPLGNTYWTILISCQEKDIYNELTRLRNRLILIFSLLLIFISFYFYSLVKVRSVLREEKKRKKAEKTLLESEEKFRRIFEDHTAIKLLINPESGAIIDANKSAALYYGWTREELKKMNIAQINTLTLDEIKQRMESALTEKKTSFEFRHRLKDGSIRDVEVLSSKIKIGNKDVLHSIIHDTTERKRVEEALIKAKEHAEESDRLKTSFLQNMSHEIRTPMNAIMGFSSLLVENYNNKSKLEKFSEIINLRCNDLLEIINDILDIAKIESGQMTINNEECNLNELFEELTSFFKEHQKRIGKQQIVLTLEALCKSAEGNIITDKIKLRQIFINLIGNAFKFTSTGKIEGGCKYDADQNLLFYVSDTGIGIPPDKQEVIFERFAQLRHDKNLAYGGTGLGLSIVKGLVGILGGKIWLESVLEDQQAGKAGGTTFYFTIPFQVALPKHRNQEAIDESQDYQYPDKTILVVEDDIFNAAYIKEMLIGYRSEYHQYAIRVRSCQDCFLPIARSDINGYPFARYERL